MRKINQILVLSLITMLSFVFGAPAEAVINRTLVLNSGLPTAPVITNVLPQDQAIAVYFTPSTANGATITGYTLTASTGVFKPSFSTTVTDGGYARVTGLTNGTAYTISLSTNITVGTGPTVTQLQTVIPFGQPSKVVGINAVGGDGQATISFNPANGNGRPIHYLVYSLPSVAGSPVSGTGSPITFTGLTNGISYSFNVSAVNTENWASPAAYSNSVTPNPMPTVPTGLSATSWDGRIVLTWNAVRAASYVLSKSTTSDPSSFVDIGTVITSTMYTDRDVVNGTHYFYKLRAINSTGTSANTDPVSATPMGKPTASTTISAVASTSIGNTAIVSFSGESDNGSPIVEYTVTSSPGGIWASGKSSPITVMGLQNGTVYTFTVYGRNAVGDGAVSVSSNSVTPVGQPTPPTTVTAVAGASKAIVSFSGAQGNGAVISNYTVTSSPDGIVAEGASSPITVSGLKTDGTDYTFTVKSNNGVQTSWASNPSNIVRPFDGLPSAPTNVSATAGDTKATVQFTFANGDGITNYTVTASPGGATMGYVPQSYPPGFVGPVLTRGSVNFTGLTNGTAYTFTVTATNSIGTSPASAPSNSVTPVGVPTAPTTVLATACKPGNCANVNFDGSIANGSPITSFTVTASPGGKTVTGFFPGDSIPGTGLINGTWQSFYIDGLTLGTAYTFTVTATNAIGTSVASLPSNSVTPSDIPTPPTTVTAVPGNGQATVSFSGALANGSPINSYTVTSSPGGIKANGTNSPITVTGLTNGVAYTFTVQASNILGGSGLSSPSNSVTPFNGAPSAPTNVIATAGDAKATVVFDFANGNGNAVTSYTVTASPGGATMGYVPQSYPPGFVGPVPTRGSVIFTGLTNNTAYTFTVTATNSIGTSPASAPSNSVTPTALVQYTTAQSQGTQYYIGVDIPASGNNPAELKAELNDRYIYISNTTQTSSSLDVSSYQVDRYFGYINMTIIHQASSGTIPNTHQYMQFIFDDSNRQQILQVVKSNLTQCLALLPSASDDYKNVVTLQNFLNAVPAPVDNGIGLLYGSTVGWIADQVELYYGSNFKAVTFVNYDGTSFGSSGGSTWFYGKITKIKLDMANSSVSLYSNDYTINPYTKGVTVDPTPSRVITSTDKDWKQVLLELRLIERNGGLRNWVTVDSSRATTDMENFINTQLAQ